MYNNPTQLHLKWSVNRSYTQNYWLLNISIILYNTSFSHLDRDQNRASSYVCAQINWSPHPEKQKTIWIIKNKILSHCGGHSNQYCTKQGLGSEVIFLKVISMKMILYFLHIVHWVLLVQQITTAHPLSQYYAKLLKRMCRDLWRESEESSSLSSEWSSPASPWLRTRPPRPRALIVIL